MTQVNRAPLSRISLASPKHASRRSLAQRRADLEAQMRASVDASMALSESELPAVSRRLKDLRVELARVRGVREVSQYAVAHEMGKAPRTFQSWENGEVEPRGEGYKPLADYYSQQLGREITKNWIMFGQEQVPAVLNFTTPDEIARSEEALGESISRAESTLLLHDLSDKVGELAGTVAALEAQVRELLQRIPERAAGSAGT